MTEKIYYSFSQSVDRLADVLREPKTIVTRDSAIKRFELTFELAWKSVKEYLEGKGIVCRSPRDCFEGGFRVGLVPDDPSWLRMMEDRNMSVHTYNEKLAEEIYSRLKDYLRLFSKLRSSLQG